MLLCRTATATTVADVLVIFSVRYRHGELLGANAIPADLLAKVYLVLLCPFQLRREKNNVAKRARIGFVCMDPRSCLYTEYPLSIFSVRFLHFLFAGAE